MKADDRELREMLGAYVLGQLTPDDQDTLESHLTECADCRSELGSLQPMATALQGLDPELMAVDAGAGPPDELRDRVLSQVHQQHRLPERPTRLRRGATALLVAASLVTAFGVGRWSTAPDPEPAVIPVAVHLDQPGITAEAGLVRHTWGTELQLEASGLTDGASYLVTFVGQGGARVPAGGFLGTGDRQLRCSVNAALPVDSATAFMVTDDSGAMVLDADL